MPRQVTFNQVVVGSIPTGLTIVFKDLGAERHLFYDLFCNVFCKLSFPARSHFRMAEAASLRWLTCRP